MSMITSAVRAGESVIGVVVVARVSGEEGVALGGDVRVKPVGLAYVHGLEGGPRVAFKGVLSGMAEVGWMGGLVDRSGAECLSLYGGMGLAELA